MNSTILSTKLPADLETGHWYSDLHHKMFLILISHTHQALLCQKHKMAEHFADVITIYWFIHSIMEEEGMAFSMDHNSAPEYQEIVGNHCKSHVGIAKWWYSNVVSPLKNNVDDTDFLIENVEKFYNIILSHIREMDQATFGLSGGNNPRQIQKEIEYLAKFGLPLTPAMKGCKTIMNVLQRDLSGVIQDKAFNYETEEHMAIMETNYKDNILKNGDGCFRDQLLRHYRLI